MVLWDKNPNAAVCWTRRASDLVSPISAPGELP